MKRIVVFVVALVAVLSLAAVAQGASPESYFEFDSASGTITKYIGSEGAVVVPATIGGTPVLKIGSSAFMSIDGLTSVVIPEGVVELEFAAFAWNNDLTTVSLPSTLRIIRHWSFNNCYRLVNLTLPSGLEEIGESAFAFSGITAAHIPQGVSTIGRGAFADCYGLEAITVDSSNTKFESRDGVLFSSEYRTLIQYPASRVAAEYVVPSDITDIGDGAFSGSVVLGKVFIHSEVGQIGGGAFSTCVRMTDIQVDTNNSSYTSVDGVLFNKEMTVLNQYPAGKTDLVYAMPRTVVTVAQSAFSNSQHLTSITMSPVLVTIESEAFSYCTKLVTAAIPSSVRQLEFGAFQGCKALKSVTIPVGVTDLADYAFSDCNALVKVVIPEGVTRLGDSAFYNCNKLTTLVLPSTVDHLGNGLFYDCTSLKTVVFLGNAPSYFGNEVFENYPTGFKILRLPSAAGWTQGSWNGYPIDFAVYTISFVNGSSTIKRTAQYGAILKAPASPSKSGYRFMGWYSASGVKFSATRPITDHATYTARFYSTNAYLKKLSASTGKWSSRFTKARYAYTLTLARSASKVRVVAAKAQKNASVSWSTNKKKWYAGTTKTLSVSKGKTKYLYFRVKAQSGATKYYTVKVHRNK